MVAQTSIGDKISPFDDLDHTSELALKFKYTSTPICCCPPSIRLNFKFSNNICNHIAIEDAIIRNPNSSLPKIFNLTTLQFGDILANLC